MKSRKSVLVVLIAVVLAAALFLFWQFVRTGSARADLARATLEAGNRRQEARMLRAEAERLDREMSGLRDALSAAKAQAERAKDQEALAEQQHRLKVLRAWMALKGAPMYRKLGWTVNQIGRYEQVLTNYWQRMQDITATAQADGIPLKDPAIQKLFHDENQQLSQDRIAAMGGEVAQEIVQYGRTQAVSSYAASVAANSFYTDTPVTARQSDQLTQILANNSQAYQQGKAAQPTDINMTTAMAQAQNVLTPDQLVTLQNQFSGNASGITLAQLLSAATKAASPAPTAQSQSSGK